MAYTIPPLDIEELPMRLDEHIGARFCASHRSHFLANFEIFVTATAHDEWEISGVTMGNQELSGDMFRKFAQYFEDEHGGKISDHVGENIPHVISSARSDAREFEMGL